MLNIEKKVLEDYLLKIEIFAFCEETFHKYLHEIKKLNFINDVIERENERVDIKKSFNAKINENIEEYLKLDYMNFMGQYRAPKTEEKKDPIKMLFGDGGKESQSDATKKIDIGSS